MEAVRGTVYFGAKQQDVLKDVAHVLRGKKVNWTTEDVNDCEGKRPQKVTAGKQKCERGDRHLKLWRETNRICVIGQGETLILYIIMAENNSQNVIRISSYYYHVFV